MICLWFIYEFFMICAWFLGFPLFLIDFPKEVLEIFDFSLIFLKFFFGIVDFLSYFHLFSWIFLGNLLEIIKKVKNKS